MLLYPLVDAATTQGHGVRHRFGFHVWRWCQYLIIRFLMLCRSLWIALKLAAQHIDNQYQIELPVGDIPTVTCISCPICQTSGNYILRDRNRGHITIPVLFFLQAGRPAPRSAQETFWGKIRISSANRSWVRPATSRASRIRPLTSTWIISFWLMGCFCIRCHQFNQNTA